MLIQFTGENFGCFRDEFTLSLLATEVDPDSPRGVAEVHIEGDEEPLRLLRAIALLGPNGSGKSTVVHAAGALRNLIASSGVLSSDDTLDAYEPFALGPHSRKPVRLGVKAVIDGRVYDYTVAFSRRRILHEKLCRWDGDEQQVLLSRADTSTSGTWTRDPQFELLTRSFRQNALLLSLADSLAPNLAQGVAVAIRELLNTVDPTMPLWGFRNLRAQSVARRAQKDAAFSSWLLARLRAADVGVADLKAEETRTVFEAEDGESDSESPGASRQIRTSHHLTLLHQAEQGAMPIAYARESLGTRRLVEMGPVLYDIASASSAKAAFIDEFDASMHPVLLRALVQHFNCDLAIEKAGGQIIFTTHETSLLDGEARDAPLRRDQVYFTEKDPFGASRLFSIAEFKERNNLNLRRRYLQGRYGALPSLGAFTE